MRATWLAPLILVFSPASVLAQWEPRLPPEQWSGAVGSYRIEAEARPTELYAEDALLLTVTITAPDPENHPDRLKVPGKAGPEKLPERYYPKRMRTMPDAKPRLPFVADGLEKMFEIEDLPDRDARPDANTWKFSYRLRPFNAAVTEIPALFYHFCIPVPTEDKDSYQFSHSEAIPIKVKPRPPVAEATQRGGSGAAMERKYPLETGPAVLKRSSSDELPGPFWLLAFFLAPPLLCIGWYRLWHRWYPDAARLVRQRRSRAARSALRALRSLARACGAEETGDRLVAIMSQYLHQRLDLSTAEPTPSETTAHLQQAEVSAALIEQFAAFFRATDEARFTPTSSARPHDLAEEAATLIRELEAELCVPRAS